jgi:hypothetical protein
MLKRLKNKVFSAGALPVLVTMAMQFFGSWRTAFVAPGLVAAAVGMAVPSLLRDSPRHAGLPELSEEQAQPWGTVSLLPSTSLKSGAAAAAGGPAGGAAAGRGCKARLRTVCVGRAALSLWLVSGSIGCLFFVFRGLATWGVVWLVESRCEKRFFEPCLNSKRSSYQDRLVPNIGKVERETKKGAAGCFCRGLTPVQATSSYSLVEVGGVLGAYSVQYLHSNYTDRVST